VNERQRETEMRREREKGTLSFIPRREKERKKM